MIIRMKNSSITGNGGHGLYISGEHEIDLEGTTIADNGGDGIHLAQPVSLMQALGLPPDTNPGELAELLQALQMAPQAQRQVVAESSGLIQRWGTRGLNASTLVTNILTIAGSPIVQETIRRLLA